MKFTWNWLKAEVNRDKHGVSFDEAKSCFDDRHQVAFFDPDHSDDEDRELLIAHSNIGRLLLVSYTVRTSSIRIISARRATPREANTYAQGI
jgi:uncharacterized DUF497 family protein